MIIKADRVRTPISMPKHYSAQRAKQAIEKSYIYFHAQSQTCLMEFRMDRHYTGIEIGSEPLEGSRFEIEPSGVT